MMPDSVMQMLTGVKEEYRGRGYGKWLKAEMMFYIIEKYGNGLKHIKTDNGTINAPMLSINERMGFKTYKEDRMYNIKLVDVKAKLGM